MGTVSGHRPAQDPSRPWGWGAGPGPGSWRTVTPTCPPVTPQRPIVSQRPWGLREAWTRSRRPSQVRALNALPRSHLPLHLPTLPGHHSSASTRPAQRAEGVALHPMPLPSQPREPVMPLLVVKDPVHAGSWIFLPFLCGMGAPLLRPLSAVGLSPAPIGMQGPKPPWHSSWDLRVPADGPTAPLGTAEAPLAFSLQGRTPTTRGRRWAPACMDGTLKVGSAVLATGPWRFGFSWKSQAIRCYSGVLLWVVTRIKQTQEFSNRPSADPCYSHAVSGSPVAEAPWPQGAELSRQTSAPRAGL